MNYCQPKIEKRESIKCKLSVDGSVKEYLVNFRNIHEVSTESRDYYSIISIISQDFYHFLKSKSIYDCKLRKKIVYYINIFIYNYLTAHHKKDLTYYKSGIIEDFLMNWYPCNYPSAPALFISEMTGFILYFYEYLLSLNWIEAVSYEKARAEVSEIGERYRSI